MSLRYAAITVLLVLGGGLFGSTKAEAYTIGIGVGLALVFLNELARRA